MSPSDWARADEHVRSQTRTAWATLLRLARATLPQHRDPSDAVLQSRAAALVGMLGTQPGQPWMSNLKGQRQVDRLLAAHENLRTPLAWGESATSDPEMSGDASRDVAHRHHASYMAMVRRQAPWPLRVEFLAAAASNNIDACDDVGHRALEAADSRASVERAGICRGVMAFAGTATAALALTACALAIAPTVAVYAGFSAPHVAALVIKAKAAMAQSLRWLVHRAATIEPFHSTVSTLNTSTIAAVVFKGATSPKAIRWQTENTEDDALLSAATKTHADQILKKSIPPSDRALIEHLSTAEKVVFANGSDAERAVILRDNPPTFHAERRALVERAQARLLSAVDRGRLARAMATVKRCAYIEGSRTLATPPACGVKSERAAQRSHASHRGVAWERGGCPAASGLLSRPVSWPCCTMRPLL